MNIPITYAHLFLFLGFLIPLGLLGATIYTTYNDTYHYGYDACLSRQMINDTTGDTELHNNTSRLEWPDGQSMINGN